MRLTYYGTAAAEGFPAIFCNCDACNRARAAGGRNIRTRSQAMLDGRLLIDFCPDTAAHVALYGLDLRDVTDCLITHGHTDHLFPDDMSYRRPCYAHFGDNGSKDDDIPVMNVWGSAASLLRATDYNAFHEDDLKKIYRFHTIRPFETVKISGYDVTPLPANHAPGLDAYIYIISDGEKTLLYAHDTGLFTDETDRWLKENRPRFDFVSLDCTCALEEHGGRHMCYTEDIVQRDRLREIGCADGNTVFCLNHFSHNGMATYDEMKETAGKEGFLVSYDTMSVEI